MLEPGEIRVEDRVAFWQRPRSMMFRLVPALRSLAALFLLLAAVAYPGAGAIACERSDSASRAQVLLSADTAPADQGSDGPIQRHGLCAHGHCHNIAQLGRDAGLSLDAPVDVVHFDRSTAALSPTRSVLLKEPPRA